MRAWPSEMGLVSLQKREEGAHFPFHHVRTQRQGNSYKAENEPSLDTESADASDLRIPSFQNCERCTPIVDTLPRLRYFHVAT